MRNLKMLTGLSGTEYSLAPGDEREFDDDEATRLVRAGFATATNKDDAAAIADEIAVLEAAEAEQAAVEADGGDEPQDDDATQDDDVTQDGDGGEGGNEDDAVTPPAFADLGAARKAYKAAFGKGAGPSWSIEVIAAKIAEKAAQG